LVQYNQSIEPFPLPLVKDELEPWRREVLELEVDRFNQANMKYVPLQPGHRYQVRYAVRTINMVPDPGFQSAGPHLNLFYVTGHAGIQPSTTPWGTYEFTSHGQPALDGARQRAVYLPA
jgi:hypothetical protein